MKMSNEWGPVGSVGQKGGQPTLWLEENEQKMENQDRKSQGDIAEGNMAFRGRDAMMEMALHSLSTMGDEDR